MIDITKLKTMPAAALLLLVFALLSGVMFIFIAANDLFFKLSFFQLILLSIVGTSPLIVINSFLMLIEFITDEPIAPMADDEIYKTFSGALMFGSIISMGVIYVMVLDYLIFTDSVRTCLVVGGAFELPFILGKFFGKKKNK